MAHGQARCYFLCFLKGKMEPFKVKSHTIRHIIGEKEKTAMKWQPLRTDKFNNSCNDEKCCEKTK